MTKKRMKFMVLCLDGLRSITMGIELSQRGMIIMEKHTSKSVLKRAMNNSLKCHKESWISFLCSRSTMNSPTPSGFLVFQWVYRVRCQSLHSPWISSLLSWISSMSTKDRFSMISSMLAAKNSWLDCRFMLWIRSQGWSLIGLVVIPCKEVGHL